MTAPVQPKVPGRAESDAAVAEEQALLELLLERICASPDLSVDELVGKLRRKHVAAVLFYGSFLFDETRSTTSVPDFYVLVDDLLGYHRSLLHVGLNLILPPIVYYARFADDLRCKYCVMSVAQFQRETSPGASDVHHLGRFSKRFALLYARDARAREVVARGALQAMMSLLPHSLALLPEAFSLEELVITQLSLSYLGEQRVAEPAKVEELFDAARDFYLELYPRVLALHLLRHGTPRLAAGGRYLQDRTTLWRRVETDHFLRRSRVRGVLRWPKYMLTVENLLQYILDKVERSQGVHLPLSERQRRHPILLGWPHFLRMRRRDVLG